MGKTTTEKILSRAAGCEVEAEDMYLLDVDFMFGNDITVPFAIKKFRKADIPRVCDKGKIAFFNDHFTPNKDIQSAEQAKMVREFAWEHGIRCYDTGRVGIEHAYIPENGLVGPGMVVVGADSHSCTHGALGAFATGVGSTDLAGAMAIKKVLMFAPKQYLVLFGGERQPYVGGKDLILYTIGQIGVKGGLLATLAFDGYTIRNMGMPDRLTMTNMVTEAGAINGVMPLDDTLKRYLEDRGIEWKDEWDDLRTDKDAEFEKVFEYQTRDIEPQVAYPPLPENAKPISEAVKDDIGIDQVVIGSCTNGRYKDMVEAVEILRGRKVHSHVRAIVIPATQKIYKQMAEDGITQDLVDAEVAVSTPTCGPCLGGHMGCLAEGERAVATTNRNFVGRMGHPGSEVYLANPAIAAASAVLGRIGHPDELVDYR